MAVVASTSTMIALVGVDKVVRRVGEEGLAAMSTGPASGRIGGRDELRRDRRCRAESGIIEHPKIVLDRPARGRQALSSRDALLSASVRLDQAAINGKAFATDQTFRDAAAEDGLEQPPKQIALPEAPVPVLREGRVIGHPTVQPELTKPAVGEVEVHFFAKPPLGADAETVTDDQHPDHQLGVDRGPPG